MSYHPSFHREQERDFEDDLLERKSSLVTRERRRKPNLPNTGKGIDSTLGLGSIRVYIYEGSVLEINDVDVIAYGANKDLVPTVGLALTLLIKAGDVLKTVKKHRSLEVGDNLFTTAGNLPFAGIIHAIGPRWRGYRNQQSYEIKLHDVITNILSTAKGHHCYRIAMPVIGADDWPSSETSNLAKVFLKAIKDFCEESIPIITDIHIVDRNETVLQAILAASEKLKGGRGRDPIQRPMYKTGLQEHLRKSEPLPIFEETLPQNHEHSETRHYEPDAKPKAVPGYHFQSHLHQDRPQKGRQSSIHSAMVSETRPLNRECSGIKYYKMDAKPRGICLIINNRNFLDLSTRVGTEKDAEKVRRIFEQLCFLIREENDLKGHEMVRALCKIGQDTDHRRFDCFVCCILSHGLEGHVYGSDGILVPIKTLTSHVMALECPSLAAKPKLFFIQACQGEEIQQGLDLETDATRMRENPHSSSNEADWIPNTADFLMGYSTVPGYASVRNRLNGSWYISKLVEVLDTYHDRCSHIKKMIAQLGQFRFLDFIDKL